MKKLRHFFMVLRLLALTAFMAGWDAKEAGTAGEEKASTAATGKEERKGRGPAGNAFFDVPTGERDSRPLFLCLSSIKTLFLSFRENLKARA